MTQYAKLINNELKYPELTKVVIDENNNWIKVEKTEEELKQEGFKPLFNKELSYKEGFLQSIVYEETVDSIIQESIEEEIPNYWEDKATQEKQRIDSLRMTPREFLLGLNEKFNITLAQVEQILNNNERAKIELNYATYVERGNPLLDQFAVVLNITPEQLDEMFINQ